MKRRGALAGIVVALAVTAAACGSGGGSDASGASVSIKTLQAAVSNSQAEPSSRFVMDLAVDADGHSETIHGEGVAAGDGKTGQFTLHGPVGGHHRGAHRRQHRLHELRRPARRAKLGGKQWVKIRLDALQQQSGGALGDLADQAGQNGPQQGLEYLQGLSGDVEKIGDDTVAGEHATHYRASIDYAKVAAELPDQSAKARDALDEARDGTGRRVDQRRRSGREDAVRDRRERVRLRRRHDPDDDGDHRLRCARRRAGTARGPDRRLLLPAAPSASDRLDDGRYRVRRAHGPGRAESSGGGSSTSSTESTARAPRRSRRPGSASSTRCSRWSTTATRRCSSRCSVTRPTSA